MMFGRPKPHVEPDVVEVEFLVDDTTEWELLREERP